MNQTAAKTDSPPSSPTVESRLNERKTKILDDGVNNVDSNESSSHVEIKDPSNQNDHHEQNANDELLYELEDNPPIITTIAYACQQLLICLFGCIAKPFIIPDILCAPDDIRFKAGLVSTTIFTGGIVTILQSTFGVRLGIIQSGAFAFIPPIMALMNIDEWRCHNDNVNTTTNTAVVNLINNRTTLHPFYGELSEYGDGRHYWRIQMISGSLMVASLVEIALGATGTVGLLMRFIGPLTIGPCLSLIALSTVPIIVNYCKTHWIIALTSVAITVIFSSVLDRFNFPFPTCSLNTKPFSSRNKQRKCSINIIWFPLFKTLPLLLGVSITWIICGIVTTAGGFPDDPRMPAFKARTDSSWDAINITEWFYVPYPGQWGAPSVAGAAVLGMIIGSISSTVESIGDYHATAMMARVPPPPTYAVNRGIMFEGFGTMIAGAFGSGHGETSYSANVATIGVSRVASRLVFQAAGILMLFFGVFGKFGAFLASIPQPIIGGMMLTILGLLLSVGVQRASAADLSSTRNMVIFGLAIFFGLCVPTWVASDDGKKSLDTGSPILTNILVMLLGTHMFIGSFVGFVLDNILPGATREQRGFRDESTEDGSRSRMKKQSSHHVVQLKQIEDTEETKLPEVDTKSTNLTDEVIITMNPIIVAKDTTEQESEGISSIILASSSSSGKFTANSDSIVDDRISRGNRDRFTI